jgi:hypothetical protein
MALMSYMKTATNKWLLMYESRNNLNRCTPYRGKPTWPSSIRISRGQRIATFRMSPTDFDGSHCSREKRLPTQSIAYRLTDLRVCTSFSPKPNNEAIGLSQAFVDDMLLGLLCPYHKHAISTFNTCLRGANPLVLN